MDTTHALAFRRLLTSAVKKEASDIHLSVGSRPMIRVGGTLKAVDEEELLTDRSMKDIVDAILPHDKLEYLQAHRDVIFSLIIDEKVRAKAHIFYQENLLAVSLRLLSLQPKSLQELQAPSTFEHFTTLQSGLLVITGNQDSGRTTLAMALLEQINRTRVAHIMTLEDPIEYAMASNKSMINQREVGSDVLSFDVGLDLAQKEDIDVLFVSDVSSQGCLRKAIDVAQSGVFVIIIMNTNSALRTLQAILAEVEPHEQQHIQGVLADVLQGIIVQQLVPKIGGGFVGVHEVLLNNPSIKTLLSSGRYNLLEQVISSSRAEGMMSFDHELARHVRNQEISLENARAFAKDRETVDSLIRG